MPLHSLPINTLDWTTFQKFCTDLLKLDTGIVDSREYLKTGSKQDGIDIYASTEESEKIIVAQCKKKLYISPSEIQDIVNLFLDGKFRDKTKEFILCTSFDFSAKENHENALNDVRDKLKKNKIEFRVWDFDGINAHLRSNSSDQYIGLVYRYFRHEVTVEFYGPAYAKYIERLNLPERRSYNFNIAFYIPRNIQILDDQQTSTSLSLQEIIREKYKSHSSAIKLILTASAGIGKSIEVRHTVNYLISEYKDIFPIYADLRNYDGQELDVFLFGSDALNNNIPNERLFLILDGLDEVSPELFPIIIKKFNSFIQRRPVHFLLSVRSNFIDKNNLPISDAQLCFLNNLTEIDVKNFTKLQLAEKSDIFLDELKKHNFFEYCFTPFYLVNLIDLYKSDNFPNNRNELLKKITLKNLHRDIKRYNNKKKINHIFSVAKKIAFLSSIIGKTAVSTAELKQFEIDDDDIELLDNLSIIEKHTSTFVEDKWSFQHKNIQEYLTAEILSGTTNINAIKDIIFVNGNGLKQVNQRILNSLSFLISNETTSDKLFNEILQELLEHDPEVLLKFESDKLRKEIRDRIFLKIWNKYKAEDLSLYSSNKFCLQDIANFCIIDRQKIEFLLNEVTNGNNIGLTRNALVLLINDQHTPPNKALIRTSLSKVLYDDQTCNSIKGQILGTLHACKILSKANFEDYLNSNLDTKNIDIREAFLTIIKTERISGYTQFILDSIDIFETEDIDIYDSIVSYYIKDTLCTPLTVGDLSQFLRYLVNNPNRVDRFEDSNKIVFESYEINTLFSNIDAFAKENKEIIILVYKLMTKLELVEFENSFFTFFVGFFKQLDLNDFIFKKALKWKKTLHFSVPFLSIKNLQDLQNLSKGSEQDIIALDNILKMCFYQDEQLFNEIKRYWPYGEHYEIPDFEKPLTNDDIKIVKDQEKQSILLDRNLFFDQASNIFKCYGSNEIKDYLDLMKSGEIDQYMRSLALTEIGLYSRGKSLTLEEFIEIYSNDKTWDNFKIKSIINMLKERNRSSPINNNLLLFARQWCEQQIGTEDFEDFFWADENGNFQFNYKKIKVFELYKILRFEMSDEMYRKILIYDLYPHVSSNSITQFIIENTGDMEKLKEKIIFNLQNRKFPSNILLNHLYAGKKLNMEGIIDIAYNELLSRKDIDSQSKMHLSKLYLELGGDLEDILDEESTKSRILENGDDTSLEWYLFDLALQEGHNWANQFVDILVGNISNYQIHRRAKLINYLFRTKNDKAIKIWISESIKVGEDILSTSRNNSISIYLKELSLEKTIQSMLKGLKELYYNGNYEDYNNSNSIYEAIIFNIKGLLENNSDAFSYLTQGLKQLKSEFQDDNIKRNIQNLILTFNNHYFNTVVNNYSIVDAKQILATISDRS
ncbi:hypothetical protein K7A41_02915 [Sphingobacterium sp. InxBP1]|uniref:NACHT domain-containing protein n=1 Tax=Sphingobacterium sp. InxBP1 TaxID=2870328 RepID=UPI0022438B3F|nr:hypothetical protein [Sphingobacterium sp. InxBP1]MCW8310170.1 hypothetical protein [Sphingobacterium sp. InxBP1]